MLLAKTLQLKTIYLKEFIYLKTGNFITEKDPVFTVNVLSVMVCSAVHVSLEVWEMGRFGPTANRLQVLGISEEL